MRATSLDHIARPASMNPWRRLGLTATLTGHLAEGLGYTPPMSY